MYRSSFIDTGTSWRSMASFTSRQPYPMGKRPRYSLGEKLNRHHSRSGRYGEEKLHDLIRIVLDPSVVQPVSSRYDCDTAALVMLTQGSENITPRLSHFLEVSCLAATLNFAGRSMDTYITVIAIVLGTGSNKGRAGRSLKLNIRMRINS
jgi:hypothetical protein